MPLRVRKVIENYRPKCEQEAADRRQMLTFIDKNPDCLTRDNLVAHITASSWIVDPGREMALMAYHNIYKSWSWTGGHADGDPDLLGVALREANEETGIFAAPAGAEPVSIESLCVPGHRKRGRYVSAHAHLNVTYLLVADPAAPVRAKADENSGVRWVPFGDVCALCAEPDMRAIYQKLMARARS